MLLNNPNCQNTGPYSLTMLRNRLDGFQRYQRSIYRIKLARALVALHYDHMTNTFNDWTFIFFPVQELPKNEEMFDLLSIFLKSWESYFLKEFRIRGKWSNDQGFNRHKKKCANLEVKTLGFRATVCLNPASPLTSYVTLFQLLHLSITHSLPL